MLNRSISQLVFRWVAACAVAGFAFASLAQAAEPTVSQVYAAAQAGKLDEAQTMIQQVLVAHPNSARAHFVLAEVAARRGRLDSAREALATAEKLAPGLPFAKPEAVQSLRAQLAAATPSAPVRRAAPPATVSHEATNTPASSFPWGIALALGGAAIGFLIYSQRKNAPLPAPLQPAPVQGGLYGPQTFGSGAGGAMQPPYGQPAYGQPGYGQAPPAGTGLGGRVMGGLATGLAVGAGVMAAQAIGKSIMGNDEHPAHQPDRAADNAYTPLAGNSDMGGQNFGLRDADSWDDGSAVASDDGGGGGDWDT